MMKFKLSKETAVSWIESTVNEIKSLLEQFRMKIVGLKMKICC